MSKSRKPTQTRTQQNSTRQMPTYAILAVIAVLAIGLIWYFMQSRSNDMIAIGTAQAAANGAPATAIRQKISPAQYQSTFAQPQKSHVLVDVRTPEEFASGHIPGAINISLQSLPQRMNELPKDQPIVVYCRSGNRSNTAAQMLGRAGYTEIYDLGGIVSWSAQGLPVQ